MNLARHHRFALTAGLGLSSIAVFDAITHGVTGHLSVFADDSDMPVVQAVGGVVHGLAYLGALWVLQVERRRIHANRVASVFGWLLFAAYIPLAVGFLLVAPFQAFGLLDSLFTALAPAFGIGFALQFLAAAGLGLSLLRHPPTGVGSRILAAIPLGIGLTIVMAVFAGNWAHPGYVEALTIIGVALLGTATHSRRHTPVPDMATAR